MDTRIRRGSSIPRTEDAVCPRSRALLDQIRNLAVWRQLKETQRLEDAEPSEALAGGERNDHPPRG